jgi:hypothetical protein
MSREWGVKWEALSPAFPEDIHLKQSREVAEAALEGSAFPGVVVCREVTEWVAA